MSSLSAARADNFYNPPTWDPSKISRDKFQGSKGANQYEQKGVIRFEMPFNFICFGGKDNNYKDHNIGMGVRFNAKKDYVKNYFTTRIYKFTMKCADCYGTIVVQTNPKERDYDILEGGRKKYEEWDRKANGAIDLPDPEQIQLRKDDFLAQMEHELVAKTEAQKKREVLLKLQSLNSRMKDDYARSQELRKSNREKKKQLHKDLTEAKRRGFSSPLLPLDDTDKLQADGVKFQKREKYNQNLRLTAAKMKMNSIFGEKYTNPTRQKMLKAKITQIERGVKVKALRGKKRKRDGRTDELKRLAKAVKKQSSCKLKGDSDSKSGHSSRHAKDSKVKKQKSADSLSLLSAYGDSDESDD